MKVVYSCYDEMSKEVIATFDNVSDADAFADWYNEEHGEFLEVGGFRVFPDFESAKNIFKKDDDE